MANFKRDCFFSQWLLWICGANPIHTKSPCLTKNCLCYQITLVLTAAVCSRQQSDGYIGLDTYWKFPTECCLQDKSSHFFTYITDVVHCFVFVVCELKNPSMNAFLSGLESSGWLKHIKAILDTSAFISKVRENISNGNSNSRTSSLQFGGSLFLTIKKLETCLTKEFSLCQFSQSCLFSVISHT